MQTLHLDITRNSDDPTTDAQWFQDTLADCAGIITAKVTATEVPENENVWDATIKVEDTEFEALMTYLVEDQGYDEDTIDVED